MGALPRAAATVLLLALAGAAPAARAQEPPGAELCVGVDHPPFDLVPDGGDVQGPGVRESHTGSYLVVPGTIAMPDEVVAMEVVGPRGSSSYDVRVAADGTFTFVLPIDRFGDYGVTVFDPAGSELVAGRLQVGPDDVACAEPASAPGPGRGLTRRGSDVDPLGVLAAILAGRDVSVVPDPVDLLFGGGLYLPDGAGDHIYSDPAAVAGMPSDATDLRRVGASLLDPPADALLGGDLDCGPHGFWDVVCPPGATNDGPWGTPPPGGFFVTALQVAATVPAPSAGAGAAGDLLEYAVVYESNGDPSDDWVPQGAYTWDGFQATDRWYVLRGDPAAGTWLLDVTDAGTGAVVDSEARAVLVDDTVVFAVPAGELAGPTGWRGYAFNHDGSYRPEYSAMDVTGADPTEPLQPMPTPAVAPEPAGPSPAASSAPTSPPTTSEEVGAGDEPVAAADPGDGPDGPFWPLVALGGVTAAGGAALLRRRDRVVVAPPDPCARELAALDAARSRCEEARAAATAARERAETARSDVVAVRAALADARAQLPGAGTRDRSSWVESEGRRIDRGDLAAADAADASAWAAYRAGEITAEEVMERWGRRGEPGEVERLREADARAEGLERQLEAVEAAHAQAAAALETAEWRADGVCAEADRAAGELERCRRRAGAAPASGPVDAGGTSTRPAAGGSGTTVTAPPPTGPVTTPETDDPRDAGEEPADGCCGSGVWLLYGRSTASFGVLVGRELVNITAVCVDAPHRWIEFEVLLLRFGLGAQVGAGGLAGLVWGAPHPPDVVDAYVNQAGGAGFDLDLGGSWVKLARSGLQLRKSGKLLDALKKLPGSSVPPPKLPPGELAAVKDAAATAVRELGSGAGQGAAASAAGQAVKGSIGDLVLLPLGAGVGVAAHWGTVEESQVVAMSGCGRCRGRATR